MAQGTRISPSMAVAFVALVAALAGTAVALPGKGSVTKDDLKKGAVTKKAIKKGAVTKKAIKKANKPTLKITRSMRGKKVTVKVTGTQTGYVTASEKSKAKKVR